MNGDPFFAGHLNFWETGPTLGMDPPWIITKIGKTRAGQIVFVEEYDPRGSNNGSFVQYRGWQYQPASGTHVWGDPVGIFHKKGTVCSFVDGHAEFKAWSDPRTLKAVRDERQDGNQDLLWLKKAIFVDPNKPRSSY